MQASITKRRVDGRTPAPNDAFAWDGMLPRFGVRVKPTGAKSFIVSHGAPPSHS